jgi:hypothetical protein
MHPLLYHFDDVPIVWLHEQRIYVNIINYWWVNTEGIAANGTLPLDIVSQSFNGVLDDPYCFDLLDDLQYHF